MDEGWGGVAIAGLLLASLSLFWQLWYALRVDRAALRVRLSDIQVFEEGRDPLNVLVTTVTNVGRRATVLQSAHLTLGRRGLLDRVWRFERRPKWWPGAKTIMPNIASALPQLNALGHLPQRLEPGDEVNIYASRSLVEDALQRASVKFVHVVANASTARQRASRSIPVRAR
jgi:hypothetical protein